ncbi:hypothetical protein N0V82_008194 [Gnomoniopsis sp. IMI 355080]|nr:hypothetical protein N0V82_008194 [Gnomoniopsis sp. IMI 355080]
MTSKMARDNLEKLLSSLHTQHPSIKLYSPDCAEYADLTKTYIISQARPAAIARPQTAHDVQALIRLSVDQGIDFNIRTGGHHCQGRALVDGALLIDMRDIASVTINEDKKTAKIGGGVLTCDLLKALGSHGLVTPCGSIGSVGYVGWSANGGYGPFAHLYGLGVDQIVGAKLVDYKGDLLDAPDELLKGIRGAGTIFGAIVELTVKVFPLNNMLVSTLVYESKDMLSTWKSLTEGINSLTLPPALNIHITVVDFPGIGKVVGAIVTWVTDYHKEGRELIDKIASFGNCIVNVTEAKTAAKYSEDNEKLVPYGVHGRPYTLNLREWTNASVSVLAKYSQAMPCGNALISIHSLRFPKPNEESVFGAREGHFVLEMVSVTSDPDLKDETAAWGQGILRELKEKDQDNILDSAYISLLHYDDADLKKVYGKHLETLISLKRKYDPKNVFNHAAPKIMV